MAIDFLCMQVDAVALDGAMVSILIPLYNKEARIVDTVRSALNQTYSNVEVLVVDDGSTDGSLSALSDAIDDNRLRVRSRVNRGANATRNELLEWAEGVYVQYLDADDRLLSTKVERQVALFQPDIDVTLSAVSHVALNGTDRLLVCPHPDGVVRSLAHEGVHTSAPLHRRQSLIDVGGWREDLPAAQEYELHLRLALSGAWSRIAVDPEPLAVWAEAPLSTSSSDLRVYRAKALALIQLLDGATSSQRPVLCAALSNAARHLRREGDPKSARRALRAALRSDRMGALSAFSPKTRWLRHPELLLSTEAALRFRSRGPF